MRSCIDNPAMVVYTSQSTRNFRNRGGVIFDVTVGNLTDADADGFLYPRGAVHWMDYQLVVMQLCWKNVWPDEGCQVGLQE